MQHTGIENVRAVKEPRSMERWLDEQPPAPKPRKNHPCDTEQGRKTHKKLLEWYNEERERQAPNRYQMALDHDFYDNLQWAEEDVHELHERGQAALVYNETAPTIDWIVGTEKRTRVDFKVLPRTQDDVKAAAAKTDTLKWLSDVNKIGFHRSAAFADAVKGGIGWLEDGVRGDPTEEPIYGRYESWKNMLHDSHGVERDLSDARYVYRLKFVDTDIACAMFPDRVAQIEQAAIASDLYRSEESEDFWYIGQHYQARGADGQVLGRRTFISDAALIFSRRSRVKLIECWYRMPVRSQWLRGAAFNARYDPKNPQMKQAVKDGAASLYDAVKMEVRCAVMTEGHLLQDISSPYTHNRFPFTPIWCYRRSRDGMAYGVIRRIRDPQEDLNKRSSKALFLLSTNRVIVDDDAIEDHDEAREEAARPDAYIIKRAGRDFRIENNVQLAQEHLMLMDRAGRLIRQAGGVTDDNLGRQTNAISGEAIKARQLQGSVVTAEIFDNLRFAVQHQGEIQLSLCEQWLTEPKVIRLVQARGELKWVKINEPEQDAMGNWRWVNDITASQADFIVDQQDFNQSTRQAMFDSMVDLVGRIAGVNAEAGLRILKMALEFSDLPNKDEMASEIAGILGIEDDRDPKDMTPEERQKWEQKQAGKEKARQQQEQVTELQNRTMLANIEKAEAQAESARGQAAKFLADAVKIQQETALTVQKLADQVAEISKAVLGTVRDEPAGSTG